MTRGLRHPIHSSLSTLLFITTLSAIAIAEPAELAGLRAQAAAEGWTFDVGETAVSDVPLAQLCGTVPPPQLAPPERSPSEQAALVEAAAALPASFDWRDHDGVTSVKDQATCGSCWAFTAMAAVESAVKIKSGAEPDLGEQWLISCTGAGTCTYGGWHGTAFDYMRCSGGPTDDCGQRGAVFEADYPFTGGDAPCTGCPHPRPFCLTSSTYVGDEADIEAIKLAVYNDGPVAAAFYVTTAFQNYTGGVFNACAAGTVNHALLIVGWDDAQGADGVWICKNSWTEQWGEAGYCRVEYGCSSIGYGSYSIAVEDPDCDNSGVSDFDEILGGVVTDCNNNAVPDACDVARGTSDDCDLDGIPDECSGVIYVDDDGASDPAPGDPTSSDPDESGSSCHPFDAIQEGIDRAQPGDTVLVAAGTYAGPGNRMLDYGGKSIIVRGATGHAADVVLDCQDSYQAARFEHGEDPNAILAALTISNGRGNYGGAIRCLGVAPTLINLHMIDCEAAYYGGAVYSQGSAPTLIDCVFDHAHSGYDSGGVDISDSDIVFIRCIFEDCTTPGVGGAMTVVNSTVSLVDTMLWSNAADFGGGGIYADDSDIYMFNTTVIGNTTVGYAGGLAAWDTYAQLDSSLFWGNDAVTLGDQMGFFAADSFSDGSLKYCAVENGTYDIYTDSSSTVSWGVGCTVGDPQLDNNGAPTAGSSCIDAGDPGIMGYGEIDLLNNMRVWDGDGDSTPRIDIGAIEYASHAYGDVNCDGKVDTYDIDAFVLALTGQANYAAAYPGCGWRLADVNRDGKPDTYDIDAFVALLAAD